MSDLPKGFNDWSQEEKSAYWEEQRGKERDLRQACIDNLQVEQREVVEDTFKTLRSTLNTLYDCQDIWLSDVKKLDDCMWKLKQQFNLSIEND